MDIGDLLSHHRETEEWELGIGLTCGAAVGSMSERACGVFNEDTCMQEAQMIVLSIQRLARTQYGGSIRQLLAILVIVLAFERCRSSQFGVLTQIDMSSHVVSHLASERTIVGFPLSSTRATVAPARLQSKT